MISNRSFPFTWLTGISINWIRRKHFPVNPHSPVNCFVPPIRPRWLQTRNVMFIQPEKLIAKARSKNQYQENLPILKEPKWSGFFNWHLNGIPVYHMITLCGFFTKETTWLYNWAIQWTCFRVAKMGIPREASWVGLRSAQFTISESLITQRSFKRAFIIPLRIEFGLTYCLNSPAYA